MIFFSGGDLCNEEEEDEEEDDESEADLWTLKFTFLIWTGRILPSKKSSSAGDTS
ncbi:hypothetical protein YC2023_092335 [Brassica napus]